MTPGKLKLLHTRLAKVAPHLLSRDENTPLETLLDEYGLKLIKFSDKKGDCKEDYVIGLKKIYTYGIVLNELYGEWRVIEYKNGAWNNERGGNWTKSKAQEICDSYNNLDGDYSIMGDWVSKNKN